AGGDAGRDRVRAGGEAQHALGKVAHGTRKGAARPHIVAQARQRTVRLPLSEQHYPNSGAGWGGPAPVKHHRDDAGKPPDGARASQPLITRRASETLSFSRNCEISRLRCFRSQTSRSKTISVKSGAVRTMDSLSILASLAAITCAMLASDPGSLSATTL